MLAPAAKALLAEALVSPREDNPFTNGASASVRASYRYENFDNAEFATLAATYGIPWLLYTALAFVFLHYTVRFNVVLLKR